MISLVVARAAHLAGDCSSGAARQHRQPGSGSASTITAGWHTLVRVWDGQQVRQYVDGLRFKVVSREWWKFEKAA
jgi:hypothetical protein